MLTIDLRSDTVTKPSQNMREVMYKAPVGDDVLNEDPSIHQLQEFAASLFGMEDALFCSSGTQTNQIAIACHTRPGDDVICSSLSHIYLYEGGGIALNSGCSVSMVEGNNGKLTASMVQQLIQPDDIHKPRTTLVSLEDTVNKGGGTCYELSDIKEIHALCKQKNLALHCDGARLFNAILAKNHDPKEYASYFDSISICLSKGLGAPVGSLLLGKKAFIQEAKRKRKVFGGGMRQAGIIAAGALYALEHNRARLQEDHIRAKEIETLLQKMPWCKTVVPVETNIVIWQLSTDIHSSTAVAKLKESNIHCFPFGEDKIRFVTHLDYTHQHHQRLLDVLPTILL